MLSAKCFLCIWIIFSYRQVNGSILPLTASLEGENLTDLVIIGLAPLTGQYGHVGQGVQPSIARALQEINSNDSLLHGYRLSLTWVDTKVRYLLNNLCEASYFFNM